MGRRMFETLQLLTLGLWLGMLVMTGVAAATLFPQMKALEPSLPEFAAYPHEHWMLAAGSAANTLFTVVDWAGVGLLMVSFVSLLVLALWRWLDLRRASSVLRAVSLVAAGLMLIYTMVSLRPGMNADLRAFWEAARAGDRETADRHRDAFRARHPRATVLMSAQTGLVLAAFVAAGASATRRDGAGDDAAAGAEGRPVEPALAKGGAGG